MLPFRVILALAVPAAFASSFSKNVEELEVSLDIVQQMIELKLYEDAETALVSAEAEITKLREQIPDAQEDLVNSLLLAILDAKGRVEGYRGQLKHHKSNQEVISRNNRLHLCDPTSGDKIFELDVQFGPNDMDSKQTQELDHNEIRMTEPSSSKPATLSGEPAQLDIITREIDNFLDNVEFFIQENQYNQAIAVLDDAKAEIAKLTEEIKRSGGDTTDSLLLLIDEYQERVETYQELLGLYKNNQETVDKGLEDAESLSSSLAPLGGDTEFKLDIQFAPNDMDHLKNSVSPTLPADSRCIRIAGEVNSAFDRVKWFIQKDKYGHAVAAFRAAEVRIAELGEQLAKSSEDLGEQWYRVISDAQTKIQNFQKVLEPYMESCGFNHDETTSTEFTASNDVSFKPNIVPELSQFIIGDMDRLKDFPSGHTNSELSESIVPLEMYDAGNNGFPEKLISLYKALEQFRKASIDNGANKLAIYRAWDEIIVSSGITEIFYEYKDILLSDSPEYFERQVGEDLWEFIQKYIGKAVNLMNGLVKAPSSNNYTRPRSQQPAIHQEKDQEFLSMSKITPLQRRRN